MRTHNPWKVLALALPLAVVANGCILIPEVEKRVVELAVGHSIVMPFHADGSLNVEDDAQNVDLQVSADLADILADNGLSANDVKDVKVASVAYRVTRGQAGKTITNGMVEFDLNPTAPALPTGSPPTAGYTQLVSSFTADASVPTGWIAVTLQPAGVTELNNLLAAILNDLKNGTSNAPRWLTYHVYGTASDGNTDFDWEFRLMLTIVGTFKADVVN